MQLGLDARAQALALFARLLGARTREAAAAALAASLVEGFGLSRASIGLRVGGRTELLPLSPDATHAPAWAARVLGAMDEAIDQARPTCWPAPEGAAAAADAPVCFELRALQRPAGGAVAVLPMGSDGEAIGAVCVERADGPPLASAELARLADVLVLAGPALRWMQQAERPWHASLAAQCRAALQRWRQPEARMRRRRWAAAAIALALAALVPLTHEVGGKARIEGAQQRLLTAPTDGFVHAAHVRPGDRVRAGQPLVDLQEQDLRLERDAHASELAQHENAYAAAMARSDRVGAATAMARMAQAQARLALVDEQIGRGRLLAPFDGVVVAGDLSQTIGAPVRQGEALLTLAADGRQRVIVEIDEVDIARIHPGQSGSLSISALPWQDQALVVEQLALQARAVEGRNVFEVQARLVDPDPAVRPGLLGRASIEVGHRPVLWAWLGHAWARLRLAWWSWFG